MIYNWRKSFEADGTLDVKKSDELSKDSELDVFELRIVSSKWSEI